LSVPELLGPQVLQVLHRRLSFLKLDVQVPLEYLPELFKHFKVLLLCLGMNMKDQLPELLGAVEGLDYADYIAL
jgi:hypothetical protein